MVSTDMTKNFTYERVIAKNGYDSTLIYIRDMKRTVSVATKKLKIIDDIPHKQCRHCKEYIPITNFPHGMRNGKDYYFTMSYCTPCTNHIQRENKYDGSERKIIEEYRNKPKKAVDQELARMRQEWSENIKKYQNETLPENQRREHWRMAHRADARWMAIARVTGRYV